MKALITGASSGIGRSISEYLSGYGYELFVVSRDKEKLESIYKDFDVKVTCIGLDLSKKKNCYQLYNMLRDEKIDILVNNAGMGDAGDFIETSLDKELEMLNLNVQAYHILTKLFLKDFVKRDYGRILNVGSIAGFMPGPYMASYYATKNYIVSLSMAIDYELKKMGSNVHISIYCPGPVKTNFSKRANVHFKINSITSENAGKYAIEGMFKNKLIIIPCNMKILKILIKIVPISIVMMVNSKIEERASK